MRLLMSVAVPQSSFQRRKRPVPGLLIVAHELGHIGCGHLEGDGSIIDVSLQEQATYEAESSSDSQEREADKYALNLLGGGGSGARGKAMVANGLRPLILLFALARMPPL